MGEQVLIIGGGVAGLRAAQVLSQSGIGVALLEGRDRLGGRIFTTKAQPGNFPVELGAEFIHGEQNAAWEIVQSAKLRTQRVPDRHWRIVQAKMNETKRFWEQLGKATERINIAAPDQDLQSFLDQSWSLSPTAKRLAKEYVEGFHAAPANRMSVHAFAKAEQAADREHATHAFWVTESYSTMVDWLASQLKPPRSAIHLNTVVETVSWRPGQVEVLARTTTGPRRFQGSQAVITLPLGVLQARGPQAVRFEPELRAKQKAIQGLGMGAVVKVTLQFRSRFWPIENFGFIHSEDRWLPTWWSHPQGSILTGWAGGLRAEQLGLENADVVVNEAVQTLARLFRVQAARIQELLLSAFHHNWSRDPFSRGAYTFTPVRMMGMSQRLAAPMAGTLFFAGEATAADGEQGTVHAALATGQRAAEQVLASLTSARLQHAPLPIAQAA